MKAEVICEKSEDFKKKKKKQERKESSDQRNKGEVIEDVIKVEERKMEMVLNRHRPTLRPLILLQFTPLQTQQQKGLQRK